MDEFTAKLTRICNEVTSANPLPDEVWISIDDSEAFKQPLKYEWRPPFCEDYKLIPDRDAC